VLEREVRANLVYRDFTRVGGTKMPDAKTMGRWGVAVGPAVVKQIHERIVQIARDYRVTEGRRMRVDTTVLETNIHYPTDSSLLGDGVRVEPTLRQAEIERARRKRPESLDAYDLYLRALPFAYTSLP
jgi:IS5 family transposase